MDINRSEKNISHLYTSDDNIQINKNVNNSQNNSTTKSCEKTTDIDSDNELKVSEISSNNINNYCCEPNVSDSATNQNSNNKTSLTKTSMKDGSYEKILIEREKLLSSTHEGTLKNKFQSWAKKGLKNEVIENTKWKSDIENKIGCDDYINHGYTNNLNNNGCSSIIKQNLAKPEEIRPLITSETSKYNSKKSSSEENQHNVCRKPLLSVLNDCEDQRVKCIIKSSSTNLLYKDVSYNSNNILLPEKQIFTQESNNTLNHESITSNKVSPTTVTNNIGHERQLHVQFVSPNGPASTPIVNRRTTDCKISIDGLSSSSTDLSSSSSSSLEITSAERFAEARAPDGGWGWVVVFASFIVNLIADGITFSFGVIFVEFLKYFDEGKAKTAWIGSLFMAIPLLSGPIASFLTDRYGCRKMTIVGSILSCLGFVLSTFSNSMEMLCVTFGILAGFGLSLCYVAAVVIVAYYFEKKRSFATGLSVCGSGIGTFIFAPLTQMLLEQYGWRGTTLILAGIFLNMCICGMLMKDLEWTTHRAKLKAKRERNKLAMSADSFSFSNSTNTGGTNSNNMNQPSADALNTTEFHGIRTKDFEDPRLFSSLVTLPTFVRNGEKVPFEVLELLSTHRNINALMQNSSTITHSRSFGEDYKMCHDSQSDFTITNFNVPIKTSGKKKYEKKQTNPEKNYDDKKSATILRKNVSTQEQQTNRHQTTAAYLKDLRMHRHSLTYRGAMLNITRYRLRASSCPDIYRNSMTTIAEEKSQWQQGVEEFNKLLLDILDFSHFADIHFLLFAFSNFLLYTWYDVPYVYLADYAIEMGIDTSDASMLVGIIGIVNMFGEIFLGWIGDIKYINASIVYAICMALCGTVTVMVPISHSFWWLCVISGFFGLFIAANYALTSIILVELITLEKFTNAYGLLLLVQGIANLVGPPLAGWIYDITGTYDLSFFIAGFFIALSGLILIIAPTLNRYRNYREHKKRYHSTKTTTVSTKICNGSTLMDDCFNKDILKETVKANNV